MKPSYETMKNKNRKIVIIGNMAYKGLEHNYLP